ncbi:MAG: hypothetical protein ACAI38_05695 [Myxococcota bacterium]|nr:hypothetical protein [Myxococcota bacterium]
MSRLLAVCSVLLSASLARATDLRVHVDIDTGAGVVPAAEAIIWVPGVFVKRNATREARIEHYGKRFVPRITAAPIGTTIHFPNLDGIDHNAFSLSDAKPFDLGLYRGGEARSVSFDRPGVIQLFCNIHSSMAAYIVIVDSKALARTDQQGNAVITDVPTGPQTVAVWHELSGEKRQTIVVPRQPEMELVYTLDAKSWKPGSHKNKFGESYPTDTEGRHLY